MERKPKGLKKSSKAKQDETEAQIHLENCDTRLQEVQAIYESAMKEFYNTGNEEQGVLLLRAVIHECDHVLRAWDLKGRIDTIEPGLLDVYGSALFHMGLLYAPPEETQKYMKLAVSQFESAFDADPNLKRQFRVVKARLHALKCTLEAVPEDDDAEPELPDEAQVEDLVENAKSLTVAFDLPDFKDEYLPDALDIVLAFMGLAQADLDIFIEDAVSWYTKISDLGHAQFDCYKGLGSCFIMKANLLLEDDAEDLSSSDKQTSVELLQTAKTHLLKALAHSTEDEEKTDCYLLLGEAYLMLRDCDGPNAMKHCADAVEIFEKCKALDDSLLPEDFEATIQSLKEELASQ